MGRMGWEPQERRAGWGQKTPKTRPGLLPKGQDSEIGETRGAGKEDREVAREGGESQKTDDWEQVNSALRKGGVVPRDVPRLSTVGCTRIIC